VVSSTFRAIIEQWYEWISVSVSVYELDTEGYELLARLLGFKLLD
jgi:hypothetical protein